MAVSYIGIGSNLGDRLKSCRMAVERLSAGVGKVVSVSKWRETEAITAPAGWQSGKPACQPSYINGAVCLETKLAPHELLAALNKIEAEMGRRRIGAKWESRPIDLDILFYDNQIINEPGLKIPHPELHKRMFVLDPLCDMAPTLVHPVFNKKVEKIREEFL